MPSESSKRAVLYVADMIGGFPGFTVTMAILVVFPFTFAMDPVSGVSLMVGVFVGGYSGGLVSGVMLGIPGTPSSITTVYDGYPMAKNGQPGRALGIGVAASFLGTLISVGVLIFFGPLIASFSMNFRPWEITALVVFALTLVAVGSGWAVAQDAGSKPRGEHRGQKFQQWLGLSEEQMAQIRAIRQRDAETWKQTAEALRTAQTELRRLALDDWTAVRSRMASIGVRRRLAPLWSGELEAGGAGRAGARRAQVPHAGAVAVAHRGPEGRNGCGGARRNAARGHGGDARPRHERGHGRASPPRRRSRQGEGGSNKGKREKERERQGGTRGQGETRRAVRPERKDKK